MTELERRKQNAERLRDDPLLNEAIQTVERQAFEALLVETEAAKIAVLQGKIQAVRGMKDAIRAIITTAQSAQAAEERKLSRA